MGSLEMSEYFKARALREIESSNNVANAMLYAVAVSDAGYELTVFEDGRSCSVVLDAAMVQQLIDLLTRPSR